MIYQEQKNYKHSGIPCHKIQIFLIRIGQICSNLEPVIYDYKKGLF